MRNCRQYSSGLQSTARCLPRVRASASVQLANQLLWLTLCATVSNNALITPDGKYGMLQTWVECVQRSGVKNFMVVALDEHTGEYCAQSCAHELTLTLADSLWCAAKAMEQIGVATWRAAATQLADKNQDNHGISSQKFHLIREFLMLGYRVLLSGVSHHAFPYHFEAIEHGICAHRCRYCDIAEPVQLSVSGFRHRGLVGRL